MKIVDFTMFEFYFDCYAVEVDTSCIFHKGRPSKCIHNLAIVMSQAN